MDINGSFSVRTWVAAAKILSLGKTTLASHKNFKSC